MNEVQWTKGILAKLEDFLSENNLSAGVEVKLPYQFEIRKYDKNWKAYSCENMGFKIDLLIFEQLNQLNIPRVAIEAKFGGVTTHDAITYSYKSELHKNITPFLRYGIMIGKLNNLPARLLNHGNNFDFMFCFNSDNPTDEEWQSFLKLIKDEVNYSKTLEQLLDGKTKCRVFQKNLYLNS